MFNNNPSYPYYSNIQNLTGYRINPIARIEEADSIFPDLQGNPLFFFDQMRNEIYVKQRDIKTAEVQTLKYTLCVEPVKAQKAPNYDEQIADIRAELDRIASLLAVKVERGTKDAKQPIDEL